MAGPFCEVGGVYKTRDLEVFIKILDIFHLISAKISRANIKFHSTKVKEHQQWLEFDAASSNKVK